MKKDPPDTRTPGRTSRSKLRILMLEDNPNDAELIQFELKEAGLSFIAEVVDTEESFKKALRDFSPDLILSDYDLPSYSGIQGLSEAKKQVPDVPFILVTGAVTEDRAIEILTSGARDYVLKNRLQRLVPAVQRALAESQGHEARRKAEEELRRAHRDLELKVAQRTADLQAEITERERIEENILSQNRLLDGINRILREAITADTEEKLGAVCLSVSEELTQSEISFIGELKGGGQLYNNNISISNPGWELCAMHDKTGHRKVPGQFKIHGLHGAVIEHGESILTNNPSAHPESIGVPEGHPPLTAFLGVPLISGGKTIGLIGVGNRKGGYTLEDQRNLEALAPAVLQSLLRKRAEEDRNRQSEFENTMLGILSRFAVCTAAEIDAEITASLKEIGTFLGLDNAYVVLTSRESRTWSSVYSWSPPGVPNYSYKYQNVPLGNNSWSEKALLRMEVIQISSLDDLPPEAQAERQEWESDGLKSHMLVPLRGRGKLVTGSVGLRSYSRPIRWTQDDIRILRLFSQAIANVLERKRAENEILESGEKYRLIFESSLNGIILSSPEGAALSINPAAQQILGMTEAEIIQRGREGIVDTSDPSFERMLSERARTGKFRGEMRWKKKDGTAFPVEVSSVIFRSGRGRAFASIIFSDITWRKHAEKTLMESVQQFRETADAMPQLVWTATPDGRIDYFNARHAEFPDITRKPSGYWEWRPAVHPEDLTAMTEAWLRGIETQRENQVEHRLKGRDGNYRWYLSRGIVIKDKAGKVIRWIGTTTDIHDLKEAETALRERTNSLEEANKEMESFGYSISHDLRTPLRAIDGFSRMLAENGRAFDRETNRRIQIIRENAAKMDRLINDLLDLSRSSRAPISSKKIDMDRLVRDIWEEQLSANPGRDLELDAGKLPPAFGDEALIRQVLSNLLANAVKFTQRRKRAAIEIGGTPDGKENVFWIKDNGVGFDMNYYDKLFGVFQRLHPESDYEGTGVGLAIVQRIIHRHGGRVWAQGKTGKGATFYFSLPARKSR